MWPIVQDIMHKQWKRTWQVAEGGGGGLFHCSHISQVTSLGPHQTPDVTIINHTAQKGGQSLSESLRTYSQLINGRGWGKACTKITATKIMA